MTGKKAPMLISQMSPQKVCVVYPAKNIKHYSITLLEINGKKHKRTYCCLHMLYHILMLQRFPKATFKMFKKNKFKMQFYSLPYYFEDYSVKKIN